MKVGSKLAFLYEILDISIVKTNLSCMYVNAVTICCVSSLQFKILHGDGMKIHATCDSAGRTPLHIAARYGQKAIVEYIVAKGWWGFIFYSLALPRNVSE